MPYPVHFNTLNLDTIPATVNRWIAQNKQTIATLLKQPHFTWENLAEPLERLDNDLNNYWSVVSHLNAVKNNAALRKAYNACLPALSAYGTEVNQNYELSCAFKQLAEPENFATLTPAQQQSITHTLRDFRLSGIDLDQKAQERFKEINLALSKLGSTFSENVLDCTSAWQKHIEDDSILSGLPDATLSIAQQTAKANDKAGYMLTLDFPCYLAVMQYADDRALRKELYHAYVTRAAVTGPHDASLSNDQIMQDILRLRDEKAKLLGFTSYAALSIHKKMAQSPEEVFDFLHDLAARSLPQAKQELAELQTFARAQGCEDLHPWDMSYYAEKQKQALYQFSSEALRPWFPVDKALAGLFELTETLFGVSIVEIPSKQVWHDDVRTFQINIDNAPQAYFYLDLYARKHKRGGAWMDVCREQLQLENSKQLPVAYLTCNFTPPIKDQAALLTHDELTTLFHEFGHGLHHMLSAIDIPSVGGISGVPWDAVELPSQFLENFCWQPEILPLISGHFETGEPLPQDKLEALLAARNFQSALAMLRQIEFSLFDFQLHHQFTDKPHFIEDTLAAVRAEVSVITPPDWARFANSFSHIFAGGYAAGYYSYKWAEVLSADAFAAFEEEGITNLETGRRFLHTILANGGSVDAMDLFVAFRGRKPTNAALLRHNGIKS